MGPCNILVCKAARPIHYLVPSRTQWLQPLFNNEEATIKSNHDQPLGTKRALFWFKNYCPYYYALGDMRPFVKVSVILCDDLIWEIWVISETWLDYSKLTYHMCYSTFKGPKNWSITFKGHNAVLLKAILGKNQNFEIS